MGVRRIISILVSVLFLVSVSNSILNYWLSYDSEARVNQLTHTHDIILLSEQLIGDVKDAETGQRGFLLTQESSYLAPFYEGSHNLSRHLNQLKQQTRNNAEQQQNLQQIEAILNKKLDELNNIIRMAEKGDWQQAIERVQQNHGQLYMNDLRREINNFIEVENTLLEQRKLAVAEIRSSIDTLIITELVMYILLGFITVAFLQSRLFRPISLLLQSTEKVTRGERIDVTDFVSQDEMGKLLTDFYQMSEQVFDKAQYLHHKATHDELTGLKNCVTVYQEISDAISDATMQQNRLALLYLDLNKFKQVNDRYGHEAGDLLLKETAKRLHDSVRASDSLFRLGGDEFLLLLRNVATVEQIEKVAKGILASCEAPLLFGTTQLQIQPSIGIAIAPDHGIASETLLKYADQAMYQCKAQSQSQSQPRYVIFQPEPTVRRASA